MLHPMRLTRAIVVALVTWTTVAIGAPVASACGVWHLLDTQRKADVQFLISTASVRIGARRVGAFYIAEAPGGVRVLDGRKVVTDVQGGVILHRGKRVGTLTADGAVTLAGRAYTIALTNPHLSHDMPSWDVEVRLGDVVIAHGDASSLCAGFHRDPPLTTAQLEDEVRRRITYYLVWRDLGRKR